MKIAIPIAQYHEGNTSDYVKRAFEALGHKAEIISPEVFCNAFNKEDCNYDLFFGVDSGEAFPFNRKLLESPNTSRLAFWFIDYRHNKRREDRIPNDESNAKLLSEKGAWIFQAQYEDFKECLNLGIERVSWLPVGADLEIWNDKPFKTPKKFEVGFVGNIWDQGRARALESILKSGIKLGFLGHGKIWKEKAAALLRECSVGFNISSFYGHEVAFDINMRFFETLSCGIPLVTNEVPSLYRIFKNLPTFIRIYRSPFEIVSVLKAALSDSKFLSSGEAAREWIEAEGTYISRMKKALLTMKVA